MSAYTLSNEHISAMLRAVNFSDYAGDYCQYYFNGEWHYMIDNLQEIGQKLVDENYRSVNFRYSDDTPSRKFVYTFTDEYTPAQIIQLCNCYDYQSCETPDWKEAEAYAIYNALRERAISRLVNAQAEARDIWSI